MKIVKTPASEIEQAAIVLAMPRDAVAAMLAPAALAGHRMGDEEIDAFLDGVRAKVIDLATERGYLAREG